MNPTIYEAIGGEPAVKSAVDLFYEKVWSDADLAPYFEGIDPDRLKRHQRAFMAMAMGSPKPYTGRKMGAAHGGLGVTDEAFDRVVGHLVDTLTELGLPEETIGQIGGKLTPLREEIVEQPAGAVA